MLVQSASNPRTRQPVRNAAAAGAVRRGRTSLERADAGRNPLAGSGFPDDNWHRKSAMRSIILWAIGIPIPLILLLAFCTGHL
jgi:hypothetical protein